MSCNQLVTRNFLPFSCFIFYSDKSRERNYFVRHPDWLTPARMVVYMLEVVEILERTTGSILVQHSTLSLDPKTSQPEFRALITDSGWLTTRIS